MVTTMEPLNYLIFELILVRVDLFWFTFWCSFHLRGIFLS